MIQQVYSALPKILIYTHTTIDYCERSKGQDELDNWFLGFAKTHYQQFARFEYMYEDTALITDVALLQKKPTHLFWISIYEMEKK